VLDGENGFAMTLDGMAYPEFRLHNYMLSINMPAKALVNLNSNDSFEVRDSLLLLQ
jgi:hypothetical protein